MSNPAGGQGVCSFILPFPISVNNMYPQGRHGKRFPSRQYIKWREQVGWLIRAKRQKPTQAPVTISIELIPKDMRRRDADNYAKGIIDALVQNHVIEDDGVKHIRSVMTAWREPQKNNPHAIVTVTSAGPL